ncbi:MAG TPA: winged helix-turn-helix domain-containing protein [Candidatus Acidoferrum sp.]|nr:winged helix-turn-helix domain-containing protein [Candidatus Acidoferrum sp.]
MKTQIGDTAGRIWKALQDKDEIAVSQLPKIVKERDALVYQGLGWLAREDKISYRVDGNKTYVSIVK